MGENRNNTHDDPARIAAGLSDSMIEALRTTVRRSSAFAADRAHGRSGTLAALVTRKLITAGSFHYLTNFGREVARAAGIDVLLIDEVHAEALAEVDVEEQAETSAREVTATGGGLDEWARRQQLAGRPLRGDFVAHKRYADASRLAARACCASTEGDVHDRECQTPAARRQQLAGRPLRTQADRTDEAVPAPLLTRERIEPMDLVTVDGADPRVWRVESVDDGRGTMSGEPYATMVHVSGTRTSIPVKRLTHATVDQILDAKRNERDIALAVPQRPAPAAAPRFVVGDRVTIPSRDERVWRIASIVPGDPDGRPVPVKPWASLTHEASRYETVTTTANLDRLAPVPEPGPTSRPIADGAGDFRRGESVIVAQGDGRVWQIDDLRESLGGERFATMTHTGRSPFDTSHTAVPLDRLRHVAPAATSQPATSQIEQQLADLAELIRNVRQVDPDLSRAVERAKYDALRAVLRVLTGWIEGARENCEALGHRGESREEACGQQFTPEDIRRMVNDAAREVGVREPWAPEAKS